MNKYIAIFISIIIVLSTSACEQTKSISFNKEKLYCYDETHKVLMPSAMPEKYEDAKNDEERVGKIIKALNNNEVIKYWDIKDNKVIVYLNSIYEEYTSSQKMGVRASLVYSLTQLVSIDEVEFYVDGQSLKTATGEAVGPIRTNNISQTILVPNPPNTSCTLTLYFSNGSGMLEKEERSIMVSNTDQIEKYVVEELLNGPKLNNLKSTLPEDLKVKDAVTVKGVCRIDLSFDTRSKFFDSADNKMEMMIYSIVNSLAELPQVNKVAIFNDGKSVSTFTDLPDVLDKKVQYIIDEDN